MPYGSQKDRVKLTQLLHRCVRQSLTGSEVALRSEIILLQCVTESGPGSSCFQDFETLPHHFSCGHIQIAGGYDEIRIHVPAEDPGLPAEHDLLLLTHAPILACHPLLPPPISCGVAMCPATALAAAT